MFGYFLDAIASLAPTPVWARGKKLMFLSKTYISRLQEKLKRFLKKEKSSEFNSRNDRPIIIMHYSLCFFTQKYTLFPPIWQPVILAVFYPKKHSLLDPHRPGITPKWGIKVSKASIFIAWGVFWPIMLFPDWFFPLIWHPVISGVFDQKNTHFWTHLDLEWHLDGA